MHAGNLVETRNVCIEQVEVKEETFLVHVRCCASNHVLQKRIEDGKLGVPENCFIRESVAYFESRLPCPTTEEYVAISKKLFIAKELTVIPTTG